MSQLHLTPFFAQTCKSRAKTCLTSVVQYNQMISNISSLTHSFTSFTSPSSSSFAQFSTSSSSSSSSSSPSSDDSRNLVRSAGSLEAERDAALARRKAREIRLQELARLEAQLQQQQKKHEAVRVGALKQFEKKKFKEFQDIFSRFKLRSIQHFLIILLGFASLGNSTSLWSTEGELREQLNKASDKVKDLKAQVYDKKLQARKFKKQIFDTIQRYEDEKAAIVVSGIHKQDGTILPITPSQHSVWSYLNPFSYVSSSSTSSSASSNLPQSNIFVFQQYKATPADLNKLNDLRAQAEKIFLTRKTNNQDSATSTTQ